MTNILFSILQHLLEDSVQLKFSMENTLKLCLTRLSRLKSVKVTLKSLIEIISPLVYRNQKIFLQVVRAHVRLYKVDNVLYVDLLEVPIVKITTPLVPTGSSSSSGGIGISSGKISTPISSTDLPITNTSTSSSSKRQKTNAGYNTNNNTATPIPTAAPTTTTTTGSTRSTRSSSSSSTSSNSLPTTTIPTTTINNSTNNNTNSTNNNNNTKTPVRSNAKDKKRKSVDPSTSSQTSSTNIENVLTSHASKHASHNTHNAHTPHTNSHSSSSGSSNSSGSSHVSPPISLSQTIIDELLNIIIAQYNKVQNFIDNKEGENEHRKCNSCDSKDYGVSYGHLSIGEILLVLGDLISTIPGLATCLHR